MHIFTSLFGYISSIILLLLALPLILIQSLIDNQKIFDPLIKGICRLIPLSFGIRIRIKGLENLEGRENLVFISNHVNLLDPVLVYGHIPRYVRGIELDKHFSWPLWGTLIKRMGHIPISHSHTKSALESLENAADEIHKGTSIVIFPEGHRTRDGELQPFMRGPFRLARAAQVPICPIALKGLWERKSVHSFFFKPGPVDFIFGKMIEAETIKDSSDMELRESSREQIREMLI